MTTEKLTLAAITLLGCLCLSRGHGAASAADARPTDRDESAAAVTTTDRSPFGADAGPPGRPAADLIGRLGGVTLSMSPTQATSVRAEPRIRSTF